MYNKFNYFTPRNSSYMVLISILIIILFLHGHILEGVLSLGVFIICIVYYSQRMKSKKNDFENFIEDYSDKITVAASSNLLELPFPAIIVDPTGRILWQNKITFSALKMGNLLGRGLKDLNKNLNIKHILDEKKGELDYVSIGENYYNIFSSSVEKDDGIYENIALLYFYDVTELYTLKKNIKDESYTIMVIEVDNLEDVVKTTPEDKAPLLVAEIERNLNNYAQELSAMIKKYTNNKYVLVVQDRYINKEMDNKFTILDTLRELNFDNKLPVTLSIGVGRGQDSSQGNYEYAQSAKELALGRGGDQAVVKSKDKLTFFGGKTKEFEKKTKVKARVIAHALVDLINGSDKIYIMGHKQPDIDCIGSAIGLGSIIRNLGKDYNIILGDVYGATKNFLDRFKEDKNYDNIFIKSEEAFLDMDENSLLIITDVHNRSHVQEERLLDKTNKIVIIDHHRKAPDYINNTILSYIETYASSTAELVTEMIPYMVEKPRITSNEAVALLAGICIDTKNFTFKTGVRTFEAAAFLRKLGADTVAVKKIFAENLEVYIKKADIMKSVQLIGNIAIAICPPDLENNVLAAQVADELVNISGISASFVLVKIKNDIFISGRSLDDVNVQVILESLGGGGHMSMAGAKITGKSMDEVVGMLKESIKQYLMEGEK